MPIFSYVAVVSDTDGSAFITKAEFDSLKNNFQAQIDNYNQSIDSKIDGAIAAYLAGIKIESGGPGLEVEWITEWKDSLYAGKIGKRVDVFVGHTNFNAGFLNYGQMYMISDGWDSGLAVYRVKAAYANKSVGGYLVSDTATYYNDYVKMDTLSEGLFLMNAYNNTAAQGGLAYNNSNPQIIVQAKPSWSIGGSWTWLSTYGRGNYASTSGSYDIIDQRFEGLVPWPTFIQYKNIWGNWPGSNKKTFFPLIKVVGGSGKMTFKWQVDYINCSGQFGKMIGTSNTGFNEDSARAYFAVYNSMGEEVKKIYDGTTEVDNIWKIYDTGNWSTSPDLDVKEGDFLGLVAAPVHTNTTSAGINYIRNGTIYMNFINHNP